MKNFTIFWSLPTYPLTTSYNSFGKPFLNLLWHLAKQKTQNISLSLLNRTFRNMKLITDENPHTTNCVGFIFPQTKSLPTNIKLFSKMYSIKYLHSYNVISWLLLQCFFRVVIRLKCIFLELSRKKGRIYCTVGTLFIPELR